MADTRIKFGKADRSEELFSEIAQENAKRIAEDGKDRWGNQKNTKSSQLQLMPNARSCNSMLPLLAST